MLFQRLINASKQVGENMNEHDGWRFASGQLVEKRKRNCCIAVLMGICMIYLEARLVYGVHSHMVILSVNIAVKGQWPYSCFRLISCTLKSSR